MYQSTISKEIKMSGIGLYSGKQVNMKMLPAPIDNGVTFIVKGHKIQASYENVKETLRRTIIGNNSVEIHTVEHLMSALYLCNITNIIIEMDGFEPPIMDGSAIEFVDCMNNAGIKKQDKDIRPIIIDIKVSYELPSKDSYVTALPYDGF